MLSKYLNTLARIVVSDVATFRNLLASAAPPSQTVDALMNGLLQTWIDKVRYQTSDAFVYVN